MKNDIRFNYNVIIIEVLIGVVIYLKLIICDFVW